MNTVKEGTGHRYGRLWAAAHSRPDGGPALKHALRCVCQGCGAHSYRVIGRDGVKDHCSVCGSYALGALVAGELGATLRAAQACPQTGLANH